MSNAAKRSFSATLFEIHHPTSFEMSTATPMRMNYITKRRRPAFDDLNSSEPETSLFQIYESPMKLPDFLMPDLLLESPKLERPDHAPKNPIDSFGIEQYLIG